jgi:WD40 repeat protein
VRPSPDSINNPFRIQCIKYAPHGNVIAVGFANGALRLVSSQETIYSADAPLQTGASRLKDICSFKHSGSAIVDISWSPDALYLATADLDQCVGLYRFYHRDEEKDKPMEWIFVGRYQSHYAPITSVYFKEVEEAEAATPVVDDNKSNNKLKSSLRGVGAGGSTGVDGKRSDDTATDDANVYYQFVAKPKAAVQS